MKIKYDSRLSNPKGIRFGNATANEYQPLIVLKGKTNIPVEEIHGAVKNAGKNLARAYHDSLTADFFQGGYDDKTGYSKDDYTEYTNWIKYDGASSRFDSEKLRKYALIGGNKLFGMLYNLNGSIVEAISFTIAALGRDYGHLNEINQWLLKTKAIETIEIQATRKKDAFARIVDRHDNYNYKNILIGSQSTGLFAIARVIDTDKIYSIQTQDNGFAFTDEIANAMIEAYKALHTDIINDDAMLSITLFPEIDANY